MSKVQFIDIDPQKDVEDLIAAYESATDTKLYPAQDAMILIKIFAYYATLLKTQFNDAANLNLVRNSRAPILDFLGEMKNCKRLEDEDDESYIERILLSPEGYSTAGPEAAYIYFAMSADSSIVAVSADCPEDNISVNYDNTDIVLDSNTKTLDLFDVTADYETGKVSLELKQNLEAGKTLVVSVPHAYKIILYVLCDTGSASEEILNKVVEKLKNDARPLCDYVVAKSATVREFEISGTVYVKNDADIEEVQKEVSESLNGFLDGFKNKLKVGATINKIESYVTKFEDVVDFELTSPQQELVAAKNVSYRGKIGTINYERVKA